ncbi:MAG: hypothetical protein AUG51_06030 [Acidobacteria bacterium 13_1_20CM_3_53_8]|nr:MAG: hypothetical protein AUG51_06030 [Acidobacteria bacterium 13_1_20CM_3_53_8]
MDKYHIVIGLALFIGGLVGAIFNAPLARISGAIGRGTGGAFSGEEYYNFRRIMNIVGGVLCAVGGLLLMLGVIHIK